MERTSEEKECSEVVSELTLTTVNERPAKMTDFFQRVSEVSTSFPGFLTRFQPIPKAKAKAKRGPGQSLSNSWCRPLLFVHVVATHSCFDGQCCFWFRGHSPFALECAPSSPHAIYTLFSDRY